MDVFYSYTYGSFAWLTLQAMPLIASPTIIITMLSQEVQEPTNLEVYFSRSLGLTLLTLGVMIVLLTGSVPLSSSLSESSGVTTEDSDPKAPYAVPTLTISTIYHSAHAFYCYAAYTTGGQTAVALGSLGSASLAATGLWCILFASSNGRISRKTGADKRTSGFPFKNQESASEKKKKLGKAI